MIFPEPFWEGVNNPRLETWPTLLHDPFRHPRNAGLLSALKLGDEDQLPIVQGTGNLEPEGKETSD